MVSGINGPCNRDCKLGRAHNIACHNYIELGPCAVCNQVGGWHQDGCILGRREREEVR